MKKQTQPPFRVWAFDTAPTILRKQAAMNGDDVDWLVWVPEALEYKAGTTQLLAGLRISEAYWTFYTASEAQAFLGAEHQGKGFLVTLTHA